MTDRIQIHRLPDENPVIYKVRRGIYAAEKTVVHRATDLDGVVWEHRERFALHVSKKLAMKHYKESLASTGYAWPNGMPVESWEDFYKAQFTKL